MSNHVTGARAIPLKVLLGLLFLGIGSYVSATVTLRCSRPTPPDARCVVEVSPFGWFVARAQRVERMQGTSFDSRTERVGRATGGMSSGATRTRDVLVLRGDTEVDHAFGEDFEAVRAFLDDPGQPELVIAHPATGLRRYGSWAMAGFGLLILVGVIDEVVRWLIGRPRPAIGE